MSAVFLHIWMIVLSFLIIAVALKTNKGLIRMDQPFAIISC